MTSVVFEIIDNHAVRLFNALLLSSVIDKLASQIPLHVYNEPVNVKVSKLRYTKKPVEL